MYYVQKNAQPYSLAGFWYVYVGFWYVYVGFWSFWYIFWYVFWYIKRKATTVLYKTID